MITSGDLVSEPRVQSSVFHVRVNVIGRERSSASLRLIMHDSEYCLLP